MKLKQGILIILCALTFSNYTLPMTDQTSEQEQPQGGDLEMWMISSDAQQTKVQYESKYMRLIRELQDQIDAIKEQTSRIIKKEQRNGDTALLMGILIAIPIVCCFVWVSIKALKIP